MIRVLVTGSGGQLALALGKVSQGIIGIDFIFRSREELDITDVEQVRETFNAPFDYCINTAAFTAVEEAEKDPYQAYEVNAEGVRNLAEACRASDTTLIHISTDYVFDGKKKQAYKVSDLPNPINEYGRSKLKGEQLIQEIMDKYFIVRTSWLYSDKGRNFYTAILAKARDGETLRVTDQQKGCPTHADNLADFLIKMVQHPPKSSGILHYTDGEAMTWYDFALQILENNNMQDKVKIVRVANYRTFAARPANSVLE